MMGIKTTCFAYRPGKCESLKKLDCFRCAFYKPKTDTANNARLDAWRRQLNMTKYESKGVPSR